jgi:hypothetical protein
MEPCCGRPWSFAEAFPGPVGLKAEFTAFRERWNAPKLWAYLIVDGKLTSPQSPRLLSVLQPTIKFLRHCLAIDARSIRRFLDDLAENLGQDPRLGDGESERMARQLMSANPSALADALVDSLAKPVDALAVLVILPRVPRRLGLTRAP